MNHSILIVEDEPLIADDIAMTLEKHGYTVVDVVDNSEDAFQVIEAKMPDMALLDINIEGEMDGIQLASKLKIPFVFLTSYYDRDTLEKVSLVKPAGFIVKPFNENDLIANLELARRSVRPKNIHSQKTEIFFIRDSQEVFSVKPQDIIYVEAFDNYSKVYLKEKHHIISHTLKSIEQKLSSHPFVRIHRSYLINFHQIDSIAENRVFLKGHQVLIGKSYRKQFFESLDML